MMSRTFFAATLFLALSTLGMADETLTRGENLAVDASPDGRLAMDLAGDLWIVPLGGGEAQRIAQDVGPVQRPRWSPDASRIVYSSLAHGKLAIWLHDLAANETRRISQGPYFDLDPSWHPDGKRIVYSSDRRNTGFDLWEADVPTGLHWRLSDRPGDETDASWSADGRDAVTDSRKRFC
jgi:Tol biopolymer transport system component